MPKELRDLILVILATVWTAIAVYDFYERYRISKVVGVNSNIQARAIKLESENQKLKKDVRALNNHIRELERRYKTNLDADKAKNKIEWSE